MNQYFAQKPTLELLSELKSKIQKFHQYKERTGDFKKWRRSHELYFGNHVATGDNTQVSNVGDDGELTAYGINHYRNLIKHVMALTCSQKPSYDYRAKNTDLESQQQARLANNIIDTYLVEKRMGRHMKQAAERALVYKLGYVFTNWDTSAGQELMAEPVFNDDGSIRLDDDGLPVKKIKYEGDVEMVSKSPWDIVHDTNLRDWSKCNWVVVREFENKWDLAAQYPKYSNEIVSLSKNYDNKEYSVSRVIQDISGEDSSDLIPVYYFFHLPSASLPSGRFTKFLTADISLYDGAYPYGKKLPVQRITPSEMFDTIDGYSEFFDIMVLQQVLNIIYSTIFTNQQAFGVQSVWVPGNCNLTAEQLSNGMVVLKGGDPDSKPQPLQLTATPAEIFKNADLVERAMEKLSGVNSVVRGDPDHGVKSGVALARIQAMAIQFSSNFQNAWAELQEDTGTFMIYLLQQFAETKRMTAIAGKTQKGAMKAWTGKDISQIERLVCDLGNPLSRTYAGRIEMADRFLDKGLIKDPAKYIELVQTGNVDILLESETSKLELIRKENEMLSDGRLPEAMVGDAHTQHMQEHRVILDDPEIREAANNGDPLALQIVQNTLTHIAKHNELHHTQDPYWFVISGEQPPPPPVPPSPENQEGLMPPPPVGPQPPTPEAPPLPPLPQQPTPIIPH